MSFDDTAIDAMAAHLQAAQADVRDVTKLSDDYPGLTIDDGYRVQEALRARLLAGGAKIVGMKMGITSRPKMVQMGVDKPIYGFLIDTFAVDDGGVVDTSVLIHPKVEAEIAFVTKAELSGPDCDEAMVLAATDFVVPAIELIDSRFRDFKFDLPSVIADNTSASRYVTGSKATDVAGLDLETLGIVMEKNGKVAEVGAGAAVLGNPATAVAMLANMLYERGESLPAGSVVLSGAITAAIVVAPGDSVTVRGDGIGSVSWSFT